MALYALTIFTSAFLLFLVQPLIAKQILPWFGGSAAVWTTCLVFFQFVLLAGYAYSDWTTRALGGRRQAALHVALLLSSLAFLPIVPGAAWKPAGDEDPAWRILGLLTATIGLPYFLLSTTGPLVQAWFARRFPGATVYRLFALSNFGSLLALVAYPFLLEPWITTETQAWAWSAGYGLFAALCAAAAILGARSSAAPQAAGMTGIASGPAPRFPDHAAWLVLPAMASFMLLAVTNHITHDVASVPFLWIAPLALYLLSFILCFERGGWYRPRLWVPALLVIVCAMAWTLHEEGGLLDIKLAVPLNLAGLFVLCMFLHGELAARKPDPRYLTRFYLMVALGGALGGMGAGLVAVKLFRTYYEYGLGLVATLMIAAYVTRLAHPALPMLALAAIGFSGFHVHQYVDTLTRNARVMTRNFYGTLRVKDVGAGLDDPNALRRLMHGVIMHGEQYLARERRREATTYYGKTSGVARAIEALDARPRRIGVVGLGTGTLAVYGRPGDVYRFYEINPQVIDVARTEFSFLADSAASIETVPGDARLAMEREPAQRYDLLAIDAFSSDAIPVHLITREALDVYLRHLAPRGIIAFHVTNRFLDLAPVVKAIAAERRLAVALVADDASDSELSSTDWVLVTRDASVLARPAIAAHASPPADIPGLGAWSDDFNNLFRILK